MNEVMENATVNTDVEQDAEPAAKANETKARENKRYMK